MLTVSGSTGSSSKAPSTQGSTSSGIESMASEWWRIGWLAVSIHPGLLTERLGTGMRASGSLVAASVAYVA